MKNFSFNLRQFFSARNFFKKIPWFFGRHAFIIILFFVLLASGLGAFLAYNYVVLVNKKEFEVEKNSLQFKQTSYRKILQQWRINEEEAKKMVGQDHPSPFYFKQPVIGDE